MTRTNINIHISGDVNYTPQWGTLERAIKQMIHPDGDVDGRFVRIRRNDRHCNYRDAGSYDVLFRSYDEESEVEISLTLEKKGEADAIRKPVSTPIIL